MFADTETFNSFAADDLDKARAFYGDTLGLEISEADGLLTLHLVGGRPTMIYPKPDFEPATYTVLNFSVADVAAAVDQLVERGVAMERYEGMGQDEKGVSRGMGPVIAWFKDPAGNILSVVEVP